MMIGDAHANTIMIMYNARDVPSRGATICCTSITPLRTARTTPRQHVKIFSQKTGCLREVGEEKKTSMSMMMTTTVDKGVTRRIRLIPGRIAAM